MPGLLPSPRRGCRAQKKTCQSDQLCLGSQACVCVNVKRHMGVFLLPCRIAWLCLATAASSWWVPPAKGLWVSIGECLI